MVTQAQVVLSEARELIRNKRFADAIALIESVDRSQLDREDRGWLCLLIAEARLQLGLPSGSEVDEAIETFRHSADTEGYARAKYLKGWALSAMGEFLESRGALTEAYAHYSRCQQYREAARALNRLSYASFQMGNIVSAIDSMEQCIAICRQHDIGDAEEAGLINLAMFHVRSGRLRAAVVAYSDLGRRAFQRNQKKGIIYCEMFALSYAQLGDIKKARELLDKCKPYLGQFLRETGIYYENVGFVETLAGNYDAAEEALNAGLKIALDTAPESSLMAQIKRLFGDLYVAAKQWDKAEQYTTEALAVAEKIQERAEIAACWRLQAQINQIRGRRDAARERYREAIELFAQIGSQWELALTRQLAGGSGLFDEGERLAQLALARDYFASEKITDRVQAIDRLLNPLRTTRTTVKPSEVPTIIAETEIMRDRLSLAEDVARSEMNVLLLGPTGTGKDLLARYIHHHSGREGEFVSVNAAAIPNTMIESELFGHKKGAFTGAEDDRRGLLEQANGGTFYLNEIADASPLFQAKLLEVLETRSARRLGDDKARPLTFRLIAACNYDLRKRAREGDFRVDLFHRLNQIPIELPPLSARLEDIKPLVRFFLTEVDPAVQHPAERVDQLAEILACFDYPGNVRELRSVVHRLAVTARGDMDRLIAQAQSWNGLTNDEFLRRLLSRSGGKRTEVARVLGVSPTTVRNRLRKLGVEQD